ncbi:hypothetical protein ACL9RF_05855 [Sphingobacterium sp. Mn56C]|uniref:hypothetical protein n=1 Tax=Sphingobacterium sp. Mn56C TaxID=3395261 RepID=UPI003BBC3762
MTKILVIAALLGFLIFYIGRRMNFAPTRAPHGAAGPSAAVIQLDVNNRILKRLLQKTIATVGIGIVMLLLTVLLAAKFKLLLILLPISCYLIGQFFLLNNHIKVVKKQRISYNPSTQELTVERMQGKQLVIHLVHDVQQVREVRAVQKNNGLLLGYYELYAGKNRIVIPTIVAENLQTKPFFDKLQFFGREIETKLFPII